MIKFHPIIQSNYLEIHDWLSQFQELSNYRQNNARNRVNKQLQHSTLESAALQYYVLFPTHFVKVSFALEQIIGADELTKWLKYNSQITVIDVGCGAGAASIAFVNNLLELYENNHLHSPISVHFLGIDPNENALAIYYQQIKRLESKVEQYNINITNQMICEGGLQAVNQLREELDKQRDFLGVPFLTHTFLFQANVVSPFSQRYSEIQEKRQRMIALGIPDEDLDSTQEVFGKEEAIAYKQVLESASIDNLHIVTVGTEGYEQRVIELAQAIDKEFQGNNHIVKRLEGGEYSTTYEIPDGCYWKEFRGNSQWDVKFCVEVSSISNVALSDEDWKKIQSTQNLQIAWARSRHHLLTQTLVDEVEIRLFESKLDENLTRLQQQLVAYAQDLVHSDDRLHFKFPKSNEKLRPLGLSTIEEEILSTALIQKLGQKISGLTQRSYAYKFSHTYGEHSTEYLYENWFNAYGKYIKDARFAAQNNEGCIIIQTDIKSFYTRIIRDSLVKLSIEQLSRSSRVDWLLHMLFAREIDEHEVGKGIVQGNIASGFFANLYLCDLDAHFGVGNKWNLEFFRYVDDMLLVVPDPEKVEEVLAELRIQLDKVGLELNEEKTERFTVTDFILVTENDKTLDNIQEQFENWINCVWILDFEHRQIFRRAYSESKDEWWYRLEIYQMCLESIGIYINTTLLSRRIYKYLFNDKLCDRDYSWKEPFPIPSLPDSKNNNLVHKWKVEFEETNNLWMKQGKELASLFQNLLFKSRFELDKAVENEDIRSEKKWIRTLRFCINKLLQTTFQDEKVARTIFDILLKSPWLIRNPHKLVESLATRGYTAYIESLLVHYSDETDQMNEYMKSIILRAIRFLMFVPESLWEQVVESAVSHSNITSLMATETWLRVIQNQPELVKESHLKLIEIALIKDPEPILRVRKNYMLILGKHRREFVIDKKDEQNTLIQNVQVIIQADEVNSLFNYYEPEILTREFYSGYRIEDGYFNPSLQ